MSKTLTQESSAIVLKVMPHAEHDSIYAACWDTGEACVTNMPEVFIDLIPYMAARLLLEWGFNPKRLLIVRLEGGDRELLRAPLGAAAATPLVNRKAPVKHAARTMYVRAAP